MPGRTFQGRAAALAGLLLALFIIPAWLAVPAKSAMRTDRLWLVTQTTEHPIDIEIAETSEEKSLGLMFRRSLAPSAGMLFPYGNPQEITMWMRNTYIPLDMVFIRADGTIHRIAANTEPHSEAIVASKGPVSAVLELAGGSAARLGIKPGDRVRHTLFGGAR